MATKTYKILTKSVTYVEILEKELNVLISQGYSIEQYNAVAGNEATKYTQEPKIIILLSKIEDKTSSNGGSEDNQL